MMFRCPECRTRRKDWGLFTQHLKDSGHRVCHCGGYHYSHRKGSPYCYENPLSDLHHATRQHCDDETLGRIAGDILANHPTLAGKLAETCEALKINFGSHHAS